MEKSDNLDLIIEFGGGAELLFGNVKKHKVQLVNKESSKWTMKKLISWIQDNLLKERPDLFIQDESVRPGILVLINDADWELLHDKYKMVFEEIEDGTDNFFSLDSWTLLNLSIVLQKGNPVLKFLSPAYFVIRFCTWLYFVFRYKAWEVMALNV